MVAGSAGTHEGLDTISTKLTPEEITVLDERVKLDGNYEPTTITNAVTAYLATTPANRNFPAVPPEATENVTASLPPAMVVQLGNLGGGGRSKAAGALRDALLTYLGLPNEEAPAT